MFLIDLGSQCITFSVFCMTQVSCKTITMTKPNCHFILICFSVLISMRPNFETAEIRCYSNPQHLGENCIRMGSTRGDVMQKESGFESKGLILLLICGVYAVFLFVIARILGCITSRLTASG